MKQNRMRGFTLLELLIVVIIVGILASVALPQFSKMMSRSRSAEAKNMVSAILTAELVYYQENSAFADSYADLLVTIPTGTNFTYGTPDITTAAGQAIVTATGTGSAAGITVTGSINSSGQKTIN